MISLAVSPPITLSAGHFSTLRALFFYKLEGTGNLRALKIWLHRYYFNRLWITTILCPETATRSAIINF